MCPKHFGFTFRMLESFGFKEAIMKLFIFFSSVYSVAAKGWPVGKVGSVPASFDCKMRKLAYAYGKQLLPRHGTFESLYYALDLSNPDCHEVLKSDDMFPGEGRFQVPTPRFRDAVFVAVEGAPSGTGTVEEPMAGLQEALDAAAERGASHVVLRGGRYHLKETLQLTPKHSKITIKAYPGEEAEISGGKKLKAKWHPYNISGANIWATEVSEVHDVPALQLNGIRATRARYPNMPDGIEASCGYGCMIPGGQANWTPPDFEKFGKTKYFTDQTPAHYRNTTKGWFNEYMIGVGGLCSVYDPPVSYWCSEHPSGGGAFAFRTPSGVAYKFPHGPYKHGEDARFFVWRDGRWANWMFDVAHYDPQTENFTFGAGGNQGARGGNEGGDFFVENLMEELDHPGEFFFDRRTKKLYFYYNGTGSPPEDVVVPFVQVLVNVSGTQWNPVTSVRMEDLKFTAAGSTYMMPHAVPSAGDWALDRYAAVFMQGTENILIENCTFDRLDGNAVMVSGYNRDATIQSSDFSYLGGNAVVAWGYTNETSGDPGRPNVVLENAPFAGVDGTDGEHPQRTTVQHCMAREIGLYEKQSSFFMQAKTAESRILSNVFFNGPCLSCPQKVWCHCVCVCGRSPSCVMQRHGSLGD